MKNKQFDCVELKQSIQEQIHNETANLSSKELADYFANQPLSSALTKWRSEVLAKSQEDTVRAA